MDLKDLVDLIQNNLLPELEKGLDMNKPLTNHLQFFYVRRPIIQSEVDRVINYSSADSDPAIRIDIMDLLPPYYINPELIHEIKRRCEYEIPTAILYLEKKEKSVKDKNKSYYNQFTSGNIKIEKEEITFFIQYETHRGIMKKLYSVDENNKIEEVKDVPCERIFLPTFN